MTEPIKRSRKKTKPRKMHARTQGDAGVKRKITGSMRRAKQLAG